MPTQRASAAMIQGYAYGALILTFFGAFWALMTLLGVEPNQRLWLIIVVGLLTIFLGYSAIALLRQARQLSAPPSPEGKARGMKMRRGFALVGGVEFVTIAVASMLLSRANREEFVPLVVALIVGIHFLPLAAIFDVPVYYVTGIAMMIVATVALLAMLTGRTLGGPFVWAVIVGLVNAVILWGTSFYVLSVGRGLLNLNPTP